MKRYKTLILLVIAVMGIALTACEEENPLDISASDISVEVEVPDDIKIEKEEDTTPEREDSESKEMEEATYSDVSGNKASDKSSGTAVVGSTQTENNTTQDYLCLIRASRHRPFSSQAAIPDLKLRHHPNLHTNRSITNTARSSPITTVQPKESSKARLLAERASMPLQRHVQIRSPDLRKSARKVSTRWPTCV